MHNPRGVEFSKQVHCPYSDGNALGRAAIESHGVTPLTKEGKENKKVDFPFFKSN